MISPQKDNNQDDWNTLSHRTQGVLCRIKAGTERSCLLLSEQSHMKPVSTHPLFQEVSLVPKIVPLSSFGSEDFQFPWVMAERKAEQKNITVLIDLKS